MMAFFAAHAAKAPAVALPGAIPSKTAYPAGAHGPSAGFLFCFFFVSLCLRAGFEFICNLFSSCNDFQFGL